jgi:ribosome-associated translation inhibitor RaiA
MKVVIQSPQTSLKDSTTEYIERRAAFAFSRMAPFVNAVNITLNEMNAAVAGKDKECKVSIQRKGESEIIVVERQANMRLAIDRALFRASYNLQRRIKRQQAIAMKKAPAHPLRSSQPKGVA